MRIDIQLTDERKLKVYDDLSHGSNPRASFFLLVAISTAIAAFGLVMNSTAVVIGAILALMSMIPLSNPMPSPCKNFLPSQALLKSGLS